MSNATSISPNQTFTEVSRNYTSTSEGSSAEETAKVVTVITDEIINTATVDQGSPPPDYTDHELITVVWVTTTIVVGVGIFIMALVAASHIAHLCRRRKNKFYLHADGVARQLNENHAQETGLTLHSITINADEFRDVDTGSVSMAPFVLKPQDNAGYEIDCDEKDWSQKNNVNHTDRPRKSREKTRDRSRGSTNKERESTRKHEKRDSYKQYQGQKVKRPIQRSKEVRADPNFCYDPYTSSCSYNDRTNAATSRLIREPLRF